MRLLKRKTLAYFGIMTVATIAIASLFACTSHRNMKSPVSPTLVTKARKIVVFPLNRGDYIHELGYWWLNDDRIVFTQARGKELWALKIGTTPVLYSKISGYPYLFKNEDIIATMDSDHYWQIDIYSLKNSFKKSYPNVIPNWFPYHPRYFWEEQNGKLYLIYTDEKYWVSINLLAGTVLKTNYPAIGGDLDKTSVKGERLYIVGNKLQEGNYPGLSDEYRYQGGYQYLVTDLSNNTLGQHFIPVPRRLNETLERPETPDSSIIYASPDYTKAAIVIFLNSSSSKGKMVEEIWVSGIDGTHQRLLGSLEAKDRATDPDRAYNVKWTPDSKRISFIHKGALYTIPAD